MQITTQARTVEMAGIDAPIKKFSIKSSAMAFKILSDKLYSDKPLAVVRELGCNAYDSHVAAGKQDVSFNVHLPNGFEPYFSIRDFGIGMTEDQVMNLYTTYFDSTKSDSNEFIGALGLGSKSPFSYVDQFTVIGYYNGRKTTYNAFIDSDGSPSIMKTFEESTIEPNGIEIMMPVEIGDNSAFAQAAKKVFHRFPQLPNISGNRDADLTQVKYILEGPNYKLRQNEDYSYGTHRGCYAIQGVVAYPINRSRINIPLSHKQVQLLDNMPLDIIFPIGDLDIAPSREELSYDKRTQQNIIDTIESVIQHVPQFAKDILNAADSVYAAKKLYGAWMNDNSQQSRFMRTVLGNELVWKGKKIEDSKIKIKMFDDAAYQQAIKGTHGWDIDNMLEATKNFKLHGITEYGDVVFFSERSLRSGSTKKLAGSYLLKPTLDVGRDDFLVVLTDDNRMGRHLINWVKHNFADKQKDVYIFRVQPQHHKAVLDQFEGLPDIILSSTLDEPPAVVKDPNAPKREIRKLHKVDNIASVSNYNGLSLSEATIDVSEGGYYVVLYNKQVVTPGHEFADRASGTTPACGNSKVHKLIKECNELGFFRDDKGDRIQLYAFNSTHKHLAKRNPKWINLFDMIKQKLEKMYNDKEEVKLLNTLAAHSLMEEDFFQYRVILNAAREFGIISQGTAKNNSKFRKIWQKIETHLNSVQNQAKMADCSFDITGKSRKDFSPNIAEIAKIVTEFLGMKPFDMTKAENFNRELMLEIQKAYPLFFSIIASHDMVHSNPTTNARSIKSVAHYIDLCDAAPSLVSKFNA